MNHCSNCGERIVGEQQFCRSCGVELVEGRRSGFDPRYLIYIGLFSVLIGAMVVLAGGFLESKTIAFAGSLFAILSFGLMLTGAILSGARPRRRRKSEANAVEVQNEQPTLKKANTTNRLPPIAADDHFPPSVTEETTSKLRSKW